MQGERSRMTGMHLCSGKMKCLLVANESAEVLFYWTDTEFQQRIQEQYEVSQEEGEQVRTMFKMNAVWFKESWNRDI